MQRVWGKVPPSCAQSELNGKERIRKKAVQPRRGREAVKLSRRLTKALAELRQAGEPLDVGEKWISENLHYIEQIAETVDENASAKQKLPLMASGEARMYALMASVAERGRGQIGIDEIENEITRYMQEQELSMDELNCAMDMARLALLEMLRSVALGALHDIKARKRAERVAQKLVRNPGRHSIALEKAKRYGVAFAEKLSTELRSASDTLKAADAERAAADAIGESLDEAAAAYHAQCAERGVVAANAISSLRALDGVDFHESLVRLCPAFGTLMRDVCFAQMEQQSQYYYLVAVSRLAKKSGKTESEVANSVRRFCEGKQGIEAHAGYYLIGRGRKTFARQLGCNIMSIAQEHRRKQACYFLLLFGLTALATGVLLYFAIRAGMIWQEVVACGLMAFVLFLSAAQDFANRLMSLSKPAFLPKMDYGELPESCRSVLCVPIVAFGEKDVAEQMRSLEVRYHAFREAAAYVLLCDLFETDEEHKPVDEEIVAAGKREAEALSKRLNTDVLFAVRPREYADKDKVWRGFDRKRGALRELNRVLRGQPSKLEVHGGALPEGVQYVLTMDADTYMAPGEAKRLVSTMAHPINCDEGYGIMQPRMSTSAASRTKSRVARLYAADGVDFYSQAASEVYMDISGEGNFAGKGVYHIDTFMQQAEEKLKEGSILSHDLIEGCLAKCALVTDIQAVDGFPVQYTSWAKREHRWTRGDWQLLPYILGMQKGRDGKRIRLSALSRWKMLDNLRRSLMPFVVTQMFALGATFGILPWPVYALVAFLPYWFGVAMDAAIALGRTLTNGFNAGVVELQALKKRLAHNLASVMMCAYEASIGVDAMLRSLYRVFISRKKLLQWVTAEQAEKGDAITLTGYYRMMWVPLFFNITVVVVAFLFAPDRLMFAVPVFTLWMLSPIYAWWLDRGAPSEELGGDERRYFTQLAQDTWQFFARYANEENGFLAPDNVQVSPLRPAVARTSPTNMGFSVLAPVNAYHFGFIEKREMVWRIEGAIASMERMEKWNGHLYNWYDIQKQEPTKPMYVSTVDSGNLAACLLTVAEQLRRAGESALAERADALAYGMDFSQLFDRVQMLMTIGFDCTQQQLTRSFYDLYASESRITSLFAVAAGQVPAKHWRMPARPSTRMGMKNLTLSWSGTAFEYLMPSLFLTPHYGTFERRTCTSAIIAQLRYARTKNVPFGISESGYASFDPEGYYQYRAFGIPTLSVRSLPRDEAVVSPYSTALIAMFQPTRAYRNFQRLEKNGARGRLGFYEAVDYSGADRGSVVRSFMAHHQGMALAALDNIVNDDAVRDLFEAVPSIRSILPLVGQNDSRMPAKRRRYDPPRERLMMRTPRIAERQKPGARPSAALLGGGGYSLYISQNGSGGAMMDGMSIYKSAGDNCTEDGGVHVYVQCNGQNISPAMLPTRPKGLLSAVFEPHKTVHRVKNGKLSVRMETCVAPGSGNEVRIITIDNGSQKDVEADICAAFEPVMGKPADHDSHPAYSNLFLHTSMQDGVLMCERRPRYIQMQRQRTYLAVFADGDMEFETDKQVFLGRNGSYASPAAFTEGFRGSLGSVVTPIMAQKRSVTVPAGKKASACIVIGMAGDAEEAVRAARAFEDVSAARRTVAAAEAFAQAQARYFGLDGREVMHAFGKATQMLYSTQQCGVGRSARTKLFEYGVSGDNPVESIKVQNENDIKLLQDELRCHALLARRGLRYDLIIADMCGTAYLNPVRQKLQESLSAFRGINGPDNGGVHVAVMDERAYEELRSCVYAELDASRPSPRKLEQPEQGCGAPELPELELANRFGGFAADGKEYAIRLERGQDTPAPWSNVIANPGFGFICTERGAGYTFAENAREYKLTPWSSDPVQNPHGEALYIKDEIDDTVFCPMGGPVRPQAHTVRHGFGYSQFETVENGVSAKTTVFADAEKPVKVIRVQLHNTARIRKKLNATYVADLVLSSANRAQRSRIVAHYDADCSAVLAHNGFDSGFAHQTAFLAASEPGVEYDLCRENVLGSCGTLQSPLCMVAELENQAGDVSGGCVALRLAIQLSPGEKRELCFMLGSAERDAIPGIIRSYRGRYAAREGLERVREVWKERLSAVHVHTPDRAMDIMVNYWLPYQIYSSRLFSRTGFYQAGGAFGFRDQLQDSISLLAHDPSLCRTQILRCAAHQFTTGDVQHWWHEPAKGVRTRITDDLLFLPYAVAEYIRTTGDDAILDENVPFLQARDIPPGEEDAYYDPEPDGEGSVYEHCVRALRRGSTQGAHGLPLIGTGDWNDGMNRAGRAGKGESVWLGFFLYHVMDKFHGVAKRKNDGELLAFMDARMQALSGVLANMKEDDRYLRAFLDDGTPLGAKDCPENAYDLITPAWAAMTGAVERADAEQGLQTAIENLYDDKAGLLRLLWPPFDTWPKDVGYIQGYLPGVRENGGQYSHGAAWALCALCVLGQGERAAEIFASLNPAVKGADDQKLDAYRAEPYVYPADIYSVAPNAGRAGWTWYTGSAGWMVRFVLEWLLGIRVQAGEPQVNPAIPDSWAGYDATVRTPLGCYRIDVSRDVNGVATAEVHEEPNGKR